MTIGRLAVPDGEGQHPAVLIAHEVPGLVDHQRALPAQLAQLGYVLVCIGTEDSLISVGERLMFEEQMRAAGVDWRMNLYGGANTASPAHVDRIEVPGPRFDEISAERWWRAMLDLFDETFS